MMTEENEPDTTPVTLDATELQSADDFKSDGKPARGSNDNTRPDWYSECQVDSHGSVRPNMMNCFKAFCSDPAWRGVFGYDLMAYKPAVCAPMPSVTGVSAPVEKPQLLERPHVLEAQGWVQIMGIPSAAESTVASAIELAARLNKYHPIRDRLNAMHENGEWDGVDRLSNWLETYLGAFADDREYLQEIGRRWLIGAIARIMEPGCKMDYMLILEGEQGTRKSTAVKIIATPDYFSDDLPSIEKDEVRAKTHLAGKWIIEITELDAIGRAEASQVKSFITAQEDVFIPKYGQHEKRQPRQCVFMGTTNKPEYLKDASGGRRFWPVKVPSDADCDIEALERDRDQLLAQAVHEYKSGVKWWPDPKFEREHITPQQDMRQDADPWEDRVLSHLRTTAAKNYGVTVTEIAEHALDISAKQVGRKEQNRIMAILQRFGWEKGKRQQGRRPWYAPDGWDEADTHGGSDDIDPIDL